MPRAPKAATPKKAKPVMFEDWDPVPDRTPAPAADAGPPISSLFTPLAQTREFAKILMYGREGSGKTTAALRAANGGRILVINAEGGLKKGALARMGVATENVVTFTAAVGESITHRQLEQAYQAIKSDLIDDPDSWYAVVIDSASDIVTSMVHHVSEDRITKARNRGVTIDEVDSWVTDRNDYGTMAKMFRDVLRKFRDLPCHLIITALERRDVDEDTGRTMYGPSVSPSLVTDLTGYMDVVLAFQAADEDRPFRAATRATRKYRAKDRLHVLPPVMVDPFFDRITAYINGDLTEDTDPEQERLGGAPTPDPEPTEDNE